MGGSLTAYESGRAKSLGIIFPFFPLRAFSQIAALQKMHTWSTAMRGQDSGDGSSEVPMGYCLAKEAKQPLECNGLVSDGVDLFDDRRVPYGLVF